MLAEATQRPGVAQPNAGQFGRGGQPFRVIMLKRPPIFGKGLSLWQRQMVLFIQQYRQQANLGEAAMFRGQFRQANVPLPRGVGAGSQRATFPEDLGEDFEPDRGMFS